MPLFSSPDFNLESRRDSTAKGTGSINLPPVSIIPMLFFGSLAALLFFIPFPDLH
jgi:hypothetical protein